jgi:hypothetical protein
MSKSKLAIIDADGLIFAIGWQFRDRLNPFGAMAFKSKLDNFIESILDAVKADCYLGFYGVDGTKNFRHQIAVSRPYKGTRVSQPWMDFFKPIAKQHFKDRWKFHGMSYIESDDACVIAHHRFYKEYDVIHISEDKDALQMGAFTRYNPKTKDFEEFTYDQGRGFYWAQHIHGDAVDSIPGIPGKGDKCKEAVMVKGLTSEKDRFEFVRNLYFEKFEIEYFPYFVEQHRLLTMLTVPAFDYPKKENIIAFKAKPGTTTIVRPEINIISI